MASAEVLAVERTDLVERHGLDALDLFLNGRDVTYVVFGIRGKQVGEGARGEGRRFGPHLLETGQTLALEGLELLFWQRGLAQYLAEQVEHGREVCTCGLDRERGGASARGWSATTPAAAPLTTTGAEIGFEAVELVHELLAGQMPGAAQHQRRQETGRPVEGLEGLGGALAQGGRRVHLFPTRFLWAGR